MKASALQLKDLLDFKASGGLLSFAGSRAVIMDTQAMGLLRKEILDTIGFVSARATMTRFGFLHGWRVAQSMEHHLTWDSPRDWKMTGGLLHALQGHVSVRIPEWEKAKGTEPFAYSDWIDSYEAEQHLFHLGPSNEPVCWTLTGFASGYLSYVNNKKIYILETQCSGCGAPYCKIEGRAFEDWGKDAQKKIRERYLLEEESAQKDSKAFKDTLSRGFSYDEMKKSVYLQGMVVRSKAMWEVLYLARRVAPTDASVLILGESGVGKERMARFIHAQSSRSDGPFVAINCGALPESLLESELFGYAKGAFSGAQRAHAGLLESANGGTLFLDEIGEISPVMQVKLLRALQEREIRRIGENTTRDIDVRILSATHRDLAQEKATGEFRADLFYRIVVCPLKIPPLRERAEDIIELSRTFLDKQARKLKRSFEGFTKEAMSALLAYDWPGNIRELENVIELTAILSDGPFICADELPKELLTQKTKQQKTTAASFALEEIVQEHILSVLKKSKGNRKQAAKKLGISEATLYRRISEYKEKGFL